MTRRNIVIVSLLSCCVGILSLLGACTGPEKAEAVASITVTDDANRIVSVELPAEDGLAIHGKFCGKNIPTISQPDASTRIRILRSIKPLDDIDKICQSHDICYNEKGGPSVDCDKVFVADAEKALKNGFNVSSCADLMASMAGFFVSANPSTFGAEKQLKTVAATGVQQVILSGAKAQIAAFTIYAGVVGLFIPPFPTWWDPEYHKVLFRAKDELILPSRGTVCNQKASEDH